MCWLKPSRLRPGSCAWLGMRARPARWRWRASTAPSRSPCAASWVVLATDGAVNPARHLGLDDWPALARSGPAALERLLARCQDWEANADPGGQQFPRAKRHDDKAIVSVLLR
jgi:ferric-dicitrate binding protein FerR (iron transport regulator)